MRKKILEDRKNLHYDTESETPIKTRQILIIWPAKKKKTLLTFHSEYKPK